MDYAEIKLEADAMLAEDAQGTIEIGTTVSVAGTTPIDAPAITTSWNEFNGVARGVSSKYVDNTTILATDLMVIIEADATAAVGGFMRIDGVIHNIIRIDNIPAAGIAVAKRVFVR